MTASAPKSRPSWPNKTRKDKLLNAGAIANYQAASQMATSVQQVHIKWGEVIRDKGFTNQQATAPMGVAKRPQKASKTDVHFLDWKKIKRNFYSSQALTK